ncbi:MAG: AmmeMemoRadiSam system protein A, partial [Thermodesulfobacteriota bacterium]
LCSTDLSHFYTAKEARVLDGRLIEAVKAFDPEALHRGLVEGRYEACGGGALVAVMMAAKALGAVRAEILQYGDSAAASGDESNVVGYLAAAFTGPAGAGAGEVPAGKPESGVDPRLSAQDQKTLLALARRVILDNLELKTPELPADLPATLRTPRGAFVTLKRRGALRGCIGHVVADAPLAEVVATMAVQAAFYDPRFPPLTKAELDGLTIEISVLTPLTEVKAVGEIQVGQDGLVVEKEPYRGLLLPQVPVEQGWDRDEFLDQTCVKAGLPPGTWKEAGVKIYRFEALVFGEEDFR